MDATISRRDESDYQLISSGTPYRRFESSFVSVRSWRKFRIAERLTDIRLLIAGDRRGGVSFGTFGDITDCCE